MPETATSLTETRHYTGSSFAKAKQLCSLKRRRGEKRTVVFDAPITRRGTYRTPTIPVHVNPADELAVEVLTGMVEISVETGHAEVHPRSNWGNVVGVRAGASARIVIPGGYKLRVYPENDATITIVTERENRVYVSTRRASDVPEVEASITWEYID